MIPTLVSSNLATPAIYGPLAQSVEHVTFNHGVPRSNRGWITRNFYAGVAELADAIDLGSIVIRRGSSSLFVRTNYIRALLAQLVEHLTLNQGVRGSSPRWCTISIVNRLFLLLVSHFSRFFSILFYFFMQLPLNFTGLNKAKAYMQRKLLSKYDFRTVYYEGYSNPGYRN